MSLDLTALNFQVETKSLEDAAKLMDNLATKMQELNKVTEGTAKSAQEEAKIRIANSKALAAEAKAAAEIVVAKDKEAKVAERNAKALEKEAAAKEKAAKAAQDAVQASTKQQQANDSNTSSMSAAEKIIERVTTRNKVLSSGIVELADDVVTLNGAFTSSQANMLASLKLAGGTADQFEALATQFANINKFANTNPFDKSVDGLNKLNREIQDLNRVNEYIAKGYNLSREQIQGLSRDIAKLTQSYKELGREAELPAATRELETRTIAAAAELNALKETGKEADRIAHEAAQREKERIQWQNSAAMLRQQQAEENSRKELQQLREHYSEQERISKMAEKALADVQNRITRQQYEQQYLDQGATRTTAGAAAGLRMQGVPDNVIDSFVREATAKEKSARASQDKANAERFLIAEEEKMLSVVNSLNNTTSTNVHASEKAATAIANYERRLKQAGITGQEAATKLALYRQQQELILKSENKRNTDFLARAIGVQMGDVGVSLASGMNPLVVMIQQGDQIRGLLQQVSLDSEELAKVMSNAFSSIVNSFAQLGTAMGSFIGGALRKTATSIKDFFWQPIQLAFDGASAALASFIGNDATANLNNMSVAMDKFKASTTAMLKLGLFAAITALTSLGVAMVQVMSASDELAKSLAQNGALLGVSFADAKSMAYAMEDLGVSYTTAMNAISDFTKSGITDQSRLNDAVKLAIDLQNTLGIKVEDTAKKFADIGKDPVKNLIEIGTQTGLVNEETIRHVDLLVQQGKTQEAVTLAQNAYMAAMLGVKQSAEENLSSVSKLWKDIKESVAEAWAEVQRGADTLGVFDFLRKALAGAAYGAKVLGNSIAFVGQALMSIKNGGIFDVIEFFDEQMQSAKDEYLKAIDDINNETVKSAAIQRQEAAEKQKSALASQGLTEKLKDEKKAREAAGKASEKVDSEYAKILERISDLNIKNTATTEDWSKSQQLILDIFASPVWNSFSDEQKQRIVQLIEEAHQNELLNNAYKEQEKALKALQKVWADFNLSSLKQDQEIDAGNKELAFRNSLIGKSEKEITKITREYEEQKDIAKILSTLEKDRLELMQKYAVAASGLSGAALESEAAKLIESIEAMELRSIEQIDLVRRQTNLKTIQEYEKDWKEIQKGLSDVIYTGLTQGGKEAAKKLRQLIEEQLKKKFIMPAIDVVINFISSGVSSLVGVAAQAVAGAFGLSTGTGSLIGELFGAAGSAGILQQVFGQSAGGSGAVVAQEIGSAISSGITQAQAFYTGTSLSLAQAGTASNLYLQAAETAASQSAALIAEAEVLMNTGVPGLMQQAEVALANAAQLAQNAQLYNNTAEGLTSGSNFTNGGAGSLYEAFATSAVGEALGLSAQGAAVVNQAGEVISNAGTVINETGLMVGEWINAASPYLMYASSILQLLQGDVEGAAKTAILTYVGYAVGSYFGSGELGAAIGSFLSKYIGGEGERYKRVESGARLSYTDGEATIGTPTYIGDRTMGAVAESAIAGVLAEVGARATFLMEEFGITDSKFSMIANARQRRSNNATATGFGITYGDQAESMERTVTELVETVVIDEFGNAVNQMQLQNVTRMMPTTMWDYEQYFTREYRSKGNPAVVFEQWFDDMLSQGLKLAIQVSPLPDAIKKIFEPLTNNDAIDAAYNNLISINRAMKVLGTDLLSFMGDIDFSVFKKDAEDLISTVSRVFFELVSLNGTFETLNLALFNLTSAGLAQSLLFKELMGGTEEMNNILSSYYDNFFTNEEKRVDVLTSLQAQLEAVGLESTTKLIDMNRLQYRELVEATVEARGATDPLSIALLKLSSVFASVTSDVEAAANRLSSIQELQANQISKLLEFRRKQQTDFINTQIDAAKSIADDARSTAEEFRTILESLEDYRRSLLQSDASTLNPMQKYNEAKLAYEETAAKALTGDTKAINDLKTVSDAFLAASSVVSSSSGYNVDFSNVLGTIDAASVFASSQISINEQQLNVANQQLLTLEQIRDGLAAIGADKAPLVVNDIEAAVRDWELWFDQTGIGDVVKYSVGTTQRLSESMGMFVDNMGQAFTFSRDEGPYGLAEDSVAWYNEMIARYGQWQMPSFDVGTNFVPNDMIANIHKGERIIPAADNTALMDAINNANSEEMISELRALRTEVSALRAERAVDAVVLARHARITAQTLEKFDIDGLPAERVE